MQIKCNQTMVLFKAFPCASCLQGNWYPQGLSPGGVPPCWPLFSVAPLFDPEVTVVLSFLSGS